MPPNPNSPTTLGLEFPVLSQPATFLSDSTPYCMSIVATASETITNVRVKLGEGNFAGAALVVDVYNAEPSSTGFRTDLVYPNADDTLTGGSGGPSGSPQDTPGLRYQNIDFWDTSNDTIVGSSAGIFGNLPFNYAAQFATNTLSLTGRRIEKVLLRWFGGHTVAEGALTPYFRINGNFYTPTNIQHSAVAFAAQNFWTVRAGSFSFNPDLNRPWTITDIQDFDGTDALGANNAHIPSQPGVSIKCFEAQVTSCVETRVATGSFVPSVAGWQTVSLLTPTGGAFAITSGTTYYYVLRSLQTTNQQFNLATLRVDPTSPVTCGFGEHLVLLSDSQAGTVVDTVDEEEATGTQAVTLETRRPLRHAIVPRPSLGNAVDAQPYSLLTAEAVETGSTMIQEITSPGVRSYSLLKVVVAQQHEDITSGSLLVKIKRRSDNVQIGSTVTITNADIIAPPTRARVLQTTLSTPASLTAQQYYVEFSSTASPGTGWYVYSLSDEDTTYDNRTFGGATDIATVDGVDDTKKDFLVTISEAPSAVAGFAATVGVQQL